MSDTTEELQKLNMGAEVELFDLDCSVLGAAAPVVHFTPSVEAGGAVTYNLIDYAPAPIEASGFDRTTDGALPQPTIKIVNTAQLASWVNTFSDFLGCTVTRTLVFQRFLDGEVDADINAYHRRDVMLIGEKTSQNPLFIEFKLVSPFDQEGRKLPRRSMLKRICPRRYRELDESPTPDEFTNYEAGGGCPYRGQTHVGTTDPYDVDGTTGPYFTASDNETTDPTEDRCGKTLASCRKRFTGTLPFGAFPGLSDSRS